MEIIVKDLAAFLGGSLEGDPDVVVNRPSKIEEGGKGSISFLGNTKYESFAYTSTASALLVSRDFQPKAPVQATLIRVDDVYGAVAKLMEHFQDQLNGSTGISNQAAVHASAKIGSNVFIDHFAIVEEGASIGNDCRIYGQVYIGKNARIGEGTILYPGVRIMHECVLGAHCIVHPNVVIGSDGFGFAPQEDKSYKKIPQIGNVFIEDQVEIGANSSIDRATMGSTIIRRGVKLDNLIQVAHNVEIGENTVISAQTGIAGSTKIGKNCLIGGQVGFSGHLTIADGTKIQAQSGIASSVETPNTALFGSPAFEYPKFLRSHAIFKQLPDLYKRVLKLEKQLKASE
jgi:UDP-3-O-[3-hydroxymyristoyl] glucosamine N-acyltransferase